MERRDDLIFDIGMHVGEDTDFYLRKGFRVVAVEADPGLAAGARARFAEAIAAGRLVIEEGAIHPDAATTPEVTFWRNRDVSVWGTVDAEFVERNARIGKGDVEAVTVPTLSVDALAERHGVPHYMKVDVEGVDTACIAPIAGWPVRPRYVSMEACLTDAGEMAAEVDLIAAAGYRRFRAEPMVEMHRRTIETTDLSGRAFGYRFAKGGSGPFGEDLDPAGWTDAETVKRDLRRVIVGHRWIGHGKPKLMRKVVGRVTRLAFGRAWPGWYDTHAAL